jgi:DNA-binding CsgD family transcriptional regulator/tetratricopeptide (TPR) repeat protein
VPEAQQLTTSLDQPVVAPYLVGRDAQVAALERAIERARAGSGTTVLVSGEAGIGKSRLIAETGRQQAGTDVDELRGRCFEPDRALPFAPLSDLLRSHLAGRSPVELEQQLRTTAPELVKLLPELGMRLPNHEPTPPLEPEQEKHRLFDALARFLTDLAARRSLLVIVEDLHWSDDTSLEFLLHFARRLQHQPILLLMTYRSDEVHPGLRHMLSTLDRERLATEVVLGRLSIGEVEAMLRAMFGQSQPIRPDFLREVHALTDGNPFFVEEIVRALVAAGEIFSVNGRWQRKELGELHIPRSVHDAVQRRVERLSDPARQMLRLAAVSGQRFDFDVLLALAGVTEPALLEVIRELIASQLVVEESADQFAFRHALTREAVYADLLARERRALHLVTGATIERLHAEMLDPYLADLSYHYHAGESWDKAHEYAGRAGARAQALYAPRAAIEHFSRALDAAGRLPVSPAPVTYRQRALAHATLGQFDEAERDHLAALSLARQLGDQPGEWQSRLDLGALWSGRDYTRAGAEFQRALDLAGEIDDPLTIAQSLIQIGNWQVNVERVDDARCSVEAALAIFESVDDRRGIALAVDLLGIVADLGGDVAVMRARLQQAIALYRELGDRQGLASVLSTITTTAGASIFDAVVVPVELARADAMVWSTESLAIASEIGWRAGEAYALINRAMYLGYRGVFAPALQAATAGLQIAEEIGHQEWMTAGHLARGLLARDLLDLPASCEALSHALRLARDSGSRHFIHLTAGTLASACVDMGDLARAAAALDGIDAALPMQTMGQRWVWLARGELALARGEAAAALERADRLLATALNLTGEEDIPRVAVLRGESLAALAQTEQADQTLRAAAEGADARGMRPLLWRTHLALGNLYQASGRGADAARELRSARALVDELETAITDDAPRQDFLSRALARLPRTPGVAQPRDTLTRRERDVVALIATGMTNREIAAALFIGERTVETHVGNVLGKLGFTARAQVAVWAVESGLARRD